MVVKDCRHAVPDAVKDGCVCTGSGTVQSQMTVDIPPHPVQNFKEIGGIVAVDRKSSCKSGIDMSMGIDESGHDQLAVGVHEFSVRIFLLHLLKRTYFPDRFPVYHYSTVFQVWVFLIQCENSSISY